jgi:hypothetical protein
MADIELKLEGEHFRRHYLIYVVQVGSPKGQFTYVGQTGDRKHITARPAFRRLAAHLEDTAASKQNQVYRGLVRELGLLLPKKGPFSDATKDQVEDFLVQSTVCMKVYIVEAFPKGQNKSDHDAARKRTEATEDEVILLFKKRYGTVLLNQKIPSENQNPILVNKTVVAAVNSDFPEPRQQAVI